ncbi:MAG: hypothetical protein ABIV21_06625, partial [Pyrinomonadaceae bacterium]
MSLRKRVIVPLVLVCCALFTQSALAQDAAPKGSNQETGRPDVVRMVGPVSQNKNLKDLRKIPVTRDDEEEVRLTRHPPQKNPFTVADDPYQIVRESLQPDAMPTPLATFPGISSVQSGCGCLPPD